MRNHSASASPLRALVVHWSLIGTALIALARDVSLARKLRAHWGIAKAEHLEAALFTALIALSREIAQQSAGSQRRSAADESELQQLQAMHALLSVVALLIQQLKRELAGFAERWAALHGAPEIPAAAACLPAHGALAYLDSS